MNSLTKNKQDVNVIRQMVEKCFSPLALKEYTELTEGYFNVAYKVTLSNDQKVILKVAPKKDVRVMTSERNIMFTEVESMKTAARYEGIPVPEVLGFDDSCTLCESPYFFMEKIEGDSLNAVRESLTPAQLESIYIESGKIGKTINEIVCPCFGYPGQAEFQGDTWYPVFRKMLEGCIEDARAGQVNIKIPADEIWEQLEKDRPVFEEVTEPKLVHWDCWDGNVFVQDGKITGIIDWERCIWGDPLLEVGFRTYSDHSAFHKGYGIEGLTEHQIRRALWYDIYLLLINTLECEYRQYETMDMYHWASKLLIEQFSKLR